MNNDRRQEVRKGYRDMRQRQQTEKRNIGMSKDREQIQDDEMGNRRQEQKTGLDTMTGDMLGATAGDMGKRQRQE